MPDVRVLDISDYVDRSNPAVPVERILVTFIAPDGRVASFNMVKREANQQAVAARIQQEAAAKLRLVSPVTVRELERFFTPAPPR